MSRRSTRNSNKFSMNDPNYKGLGNFGNTCYLNVIIQLLKSLPQFKQYITDDFADLYGTKHGDAILSINNSIAFNLHKVFTSMTNSNKLVWPESLRNTLRTKHFMFTDDDQQDAHEALTTIIELLHSEVSQSIDITVLNNEESLGEKCKEFYSNSFSPIYKMFHGIYYTVKECTNCKHIRHSYEPDPCLKLDIPVSEFNNIVDYSQYITVKCKVPHVKIPTEQLTMISNLISQCLSEDVKQQIQHHEHVKHESNQVISLIDCINNYAKMEEIEGVDCSNCNTRCNVNCIYGLAIAPEILIIQLKRFRFGHPKNCTKVKISHVIDIDTLHGVQGYKLKSIINHVGSDSRCGHYYMLTYNSDIQKWIEINDKSVTLCNEEDISLNDTYLMVYEKIN